MQYLPTKICIKIPTCICRDQHRVFGTVDKLLNQRTAKLFHQHLALLQKRLKIGDLVVGEHSNTIVTIVVFDNQRKIQIP